ncbi:MAG: DNA polymerase III subunit delta [Hyphomicrobiales bacterium]
MAVIKGQQADAFTRKPNPKYRTILIYGPDRGVVKERARRLVETVAGTTDDPFTIARLDDSALSEDPGRLSDEARAIPMMGGARVVWVRSAGTGFTAAARAYVEDQAPDAWVIAEAAELPPSSKLRQLFEKTDMAAALPCYADSAKSLDDVIDEELGRSGLTIEPDARHRLTATLGADRGLSRSEVEKLCLYCHGASVVTLQDVDAVCGDVSSLGIDDLVDRTFEGDLERSDAAFSRLMASGTAVQSVLGAVFTHLARLRAIQASGGGNLDSALSRLRPPLHFSRKASIKKQARLWSLQDLKRAGAANAEAEFRSRGGDGLSEVIVGRHLMTLAHAARQKQRRL